MSNEQIYETMEEIGQDLLDILDIIEEQGKYNSDLYDLLKDYAQNLIIDAKAMREEDDDLD
jgi:hypothetical protein